MSNKLLDSGDFIPISSHHIKNQIFKFGEASTKTAALLASSILLTNSPFPAAAKEIANWQKVDLPVRETLFDISFDSSKPLHGWIVGSKGTFLETFDGKLQLNLLIKFMSNS